MYIFLIKILLLTYFFFICKKYSIICSLVFFNWNFFILNFLQNMIFIIVFLFLSYIIFFFFFFKITCFLFFLIFSFLYNFIFFIKENFFFFFINLLKFFITVFFFFKKKINIFMDFFFKITNFLWSFEKINSNFLVKFLCKIKFHIRKKINFFLKSIFIKKIKNLPIIFKNLFTIFKNLNLKYIFKIRKKLNNLFNFFLILNIYFKFKFLKMVNKFLKIIGRFLKIIGRFFIFLILKYIFKIRKIKLDKKISNLFSKKLEKKHKLRFYSETQFMLFFFNINIFFLLKTFKKNNIWDLINFFLKNTFFSKWNFFENEYFLLKFQNKKYINITYSFYEIKIVDFFVFLEKKPDLFFKEIESIAKLLTDPSSKAFTEKIKYEELFQYFFNKKILEIDSQEQCLEFKNLVKISKTKKFFLKENYFFYFFNHFFNTLTKENFEKKIFLEEKKDNLTIKLLIFKWIINNKSYFDRKLELRKKKINSYFFKIKKKFFFNFKKIRINLFFLTEFYYNINNFIKKSSFSIKNFLYNYYLKNNKNLSKVKQKFIYLLLLRNINYSYEYFNTLNQMNIFYLKNYNYLIKKKKNVFFYKKKI